tara:strand:- start:690 stop:965 length:276 start_codon:yes stop_codon:yes gene_type:complete
MTGKFKIGQKVVYVGAAAQGGFLVPQRHEIIAVSAHDTEGYFCAGYELAPDGAAQVFEEHELRELDYAFANRLLNHVIEEVIIDRYRNKLN